MTALVYSIFAVFCFYYYIFPTTSDATLSLNIDDSATVYLSRDGSAYTQIGDMQRWQTQSVINIPEIGITPFSLIKFECVNKAFAGGFIANINYKSIDYYTTNPIETSLFELISSSDGITSPLQYKANGASPWDDVAKPNIPDNAFWIWNGEEGNTMVFLFNFSTIVTSPTKSPSFNPSVYPTKLPSVSPILTDAPTRNPSSDPSSDPSSSPSSNPSIQPTALPITAPPTQSSVTSKPTISPESSTPVDSNSTEPPDTESTESREKAPVDETTADFISIDIIVVILGGVVALICIAIVFVIGLWCGEYRKRKKAIIQRKMDEIMTPVPPNTIQQGNSHDGTSLHNRVASASYSEHNGPHLQHQTRDNKAMRREKADTMYVDAENECKVMHYGHNLGATPNGGIGIVNVEMVRVGSMQKTKGQDAGEARSDLAGLEEESSSSDHSNDGLWDNIHQENAPPTPGFQ